ncbi:TetR family transcriptional regulator [Mycolicibacterium phlei]|nr:TetR/AcrR family transcriptional regulator [Mycolicibacterium phlei]VEG10760.1 TetR family transcriptional regulator [Mycobacteroides chelonae]AMO62659.1 HTH-type transcriptional regulator BetI [Mycolicibacterium phlei]KXW65500.1 TetR family transcriptional regulator [Mycolicibacterium phlei DSM 43070]KXW70856.1 TetR family transcriptional regulator [Mycolicibacterium phlei DSM 43072]KXW76118.1 TetR family transcriptional regulator [Mycolicibacterium phlei DSM 43071]
MSAPGPDERPGVDRIREAALRLFAARGTAATSLRLVASEAGVSLGMVQHHFATKANLIKAVDDHVLRVLKTALARPVPEPPADSIGQVGSQITSLITDEPLVCAYIGQALTEGSALGGQVFDMLAEMGVKRWRDRAELGLTRPDLDPTWSVLNPLILALGAWVLRAHIDRHLPEPFETPEQLQRWQEATSDLLREGQMRQPEP